MTTSCPPTPARMRTRLLSVLGLLVAVSASACGSDDGGEASADSEAESASDDLAYYQCMRDQGIDIEDPPPAEGGGRRVQLPDIGDPDTAAAHEACQELLPNGGEMPEMDESQVEAMREVAACMRDQGIDQPDPGPDGAMPIPEGVDPESAEYQQAIGECQSHAEGGPMIIGGPRP